MYIISSGVNAAGEGKTYTESILSAGNSPTVWAVNKLHCLTAAVQRAFLVNGRPFLFLKACDI